MNRGIALIVMVGILMLLSLAGAGLVRMAGRSRAQGILTVDCAFARLLARSGIEYGSARLFQDTAAAKSPSVSNQADDWTYRDGPQIPLEKSSNPSYAQTEPYTDLGGDGRYDPSVDTAPAAGDWNRNGRFDAWSGRLRRRREIGAVFALKIETSAGRVDVNQGCISATDINRDGVPDHRQPGWRTYYDYERNGAAGPVPGLYFDVAYGFAEPHWRLADTVNHLGRLLATRNPLREPD